MKSRGIARTTRWILGVLLALGIARSGPAKSYMRVHYPFWGYGSYGDTFLVELPGSDGLLDTADDRCLLIDGGRSSNYELRTFLDDLGIDRIHYMVLSHHHSDHYGGLNSISLPVDHFYENYADYRSSGLRSHATYSHTVDRGDYLSWTSPSHAPRVGPGWDMNVEAKVVLAYEGYPSDRNRESVVIRIRFGESTFLIGGDCKGSIEDDISQADVSDTDVYKVHHHGSRYSSYTTLLNWMKPRYAVQQEGGGSDHPYADALNRIRNTGAIIYRNDLDGHITFRCDDEGNYDVTRETLYPSGKNPSGAYVAAPPSIPTGLGAGEITTESVSLDWNANPSGEGVVGYRVFRSETSGGDAGAGVSYKPGMSMPTGIYACVNPSPVSASSFTDGGLEPDTNYFYRVSALNGYGYERCYSGEVEVRTLPLGYDTDLNDDNVTDGEDVGILFSWWDSADPVADIDRSGLVDVADYVILVEAIEF